MNAIDNYRYSTDLEDNKHLVVTNKNPQYIMIVDENGNSCVKSTLKKPICDVTVQSSEGKQLLRKMEDIFERRKQYCTELLETGLLKLTEQYYNEIDNADMNDSLEKKKQLEDEIKANQIKANQFKNLLKDSKMRLFEYIYNRAEWFAGAEHKNVLTGVLCHISTMNGKPIWFLPLGRAGEGKSFIEEASLEFIPNSHIINGLKSKPVLFRLSVTEGSNYVDRKILTMGDLGEKQDYEENRAVMKTYKKLTTDGHDEYEVTGEGNDSITGERTLLSLNLVGYPSVCFTSVQSEGIDDQFLSRGVTVTPTATDEEAIKFIMFMEEGMSSRAEHDRIIKEEMPLFHGFILNILHEHRDDNVLNPYFLCLSDWLKASEFRKREMGKYLNLVKVVTLLHADERESILVDGNRLYLSTEEDNQIIAGIFNPSTGLSGDAIELFNRLLEIYKPYDPDELRIYESENKNMEDFDTIFSVSSARKVLRNSKRFRGLPFGDIFSSLNKAHLDAVGKIKQSNTNVYTITEDAYQKIKSDRMNIKPKKIMEYLDNVLPYYDSDRSVLTHNILEKIENENKVPRPMLDKLERPPWIYDVKLKGV